MADLATPTNITLALIHDRIRIKWTDSTSEGASVEIERKANDGNFSLLDTIEPGVEQFDDTSVPEGDLCYRLRAVKLFEEETEDLVAEGRYTNAPSSELKALIDDTIKGLKEDGIWDLADAMWVRGVHESLFACQNWKENDHNSTLVNSPTFTAGEGFTGNGTSSYIDNDFIPSTDAEQMSLNDLSIVFMHNTIGTNTGRGLWGCQKSTTPTGRLMSLFYTTGNDRFYIGSNQYNANVNMSDGKYYGFTRYLSGSNPYIQAYEDGSAAGSAVYAAALSALPPYSFLELSYNLDGTVQNKLNAQASFMWIGKGLTATQHANLVSRMQNFFNNVGGTL